MTISVIINGVTYDLASDMIEIAETFGTDAAASLNAFVEKAEESITSETAETIEPQTPEEWDDFMHSLAKRGQAKNVLKFLDRCWIGGGESYYYGSFVEDAASWRHFNDPVYINKNGEGGWYSVRAGEKNSCEKVEFVFIGNYVYSYMYDSHNDVYKLYYTCKSIHEHAMKLNYDPEWKDFREYINIDDIEIVIA